MRHLFDIDDLSTDELKDILRLSTLTVPPVLQGKGVALLFEKPSARTRNSMEMAVVQLGGHPLTIRPDEVGLDVRESTEDVARTLACYHAIIAARVFDHHKLERMASVVSVPVINLLSDKAHPLQALADVLTMATEWGGIEGLANKKVAFIGDANNVAQSLAKSCGRLGMQFSYATPLGYDFDEEAKQQIAQTGCQLQHHEDPFAAVVDADAVVTDVWTSMGDEHEADIRKSAFAAYTVDDALMAAAKPTAIFLHCLPAHRGEEVAASVLDGPQSRVWPEAENRMHTARGVMAWLMENR